MKEKRISLRFREENEQDMKAWKILEKKAKEKNISKNAAVIDLILSKEEQVDSADELAKRIALLVAEEIKKNGMSIPISSEARGNSVSGKAENTIIKEGTDSPADEPEVLGEEALDFLEMFG